MLKSLSFSAFVAVALAAGAVLAAEPAAMTPPTASSGMLVSAKGMTLYTFDKDTPGKSMCNGPCATNWPPMFVADGGKASGDSTIVVGGDGRKQSARQG